jgi:hypothetical protein
LGEFSPIGRLITLAVFFILFKDEDRIFVLLFSTVKVVHYFWQKIGLATFWANFLQTHPVALVGVERKWCLRAFTAL